MTCGASQTHGLAFTGAQQRCVWTVGPSTSTSSRRLTQGGTMRVWATNSTASRRSRNEGSATRCRRGPMTCPPTAPARQVAVIISLGHLWRQSDRLAPMDAAYLARGHLRCGLHLETKGASTSTVLWIRLDSCGRHGSPVQSSARPKRKKSSKRRRRSLASHKSTSNGSAPNFDRGQLPSGDHAMPSAEQEPRDRSQGHP